MFLIAVLSSFINWDYIIVRVKLLVYDVWFVEHYKTGLLSVGVDIFDRLYLKERPISLPMVTMSSINKYMIKRLCENTQQKSKYVKILMNNQNIMFG